MTTAPAPAPTMLTPDQAAARLSVSRATIDRMIRDGELRGIHVGRPDAKRRTVRIPVADLDAYVARA